MADEIWNVAGAIIIALGGGAFLVLAMSSWLGKVWATRILESEKSKYQAEFAVLKSDLDKKIHEHNVAVTRIDAQRVEAIKLLYGALIGWHEAAVQILAPNRLKDRPLPQEIETYRIWASDLRAQSVTLEKLAMATAIYLSEETYCLVARCGYSASMMSIEFSSSIFENLPPTPELHMARIEDARGKLDREYKKTYGPAREAVIGEFRRIIDPRIQVGS